MKKHLCLITTLVAGTPFTPLHSGKQELNSRTQVVENINITSESIVERLFKVYEWFNTISNPSNSYHMKMLEEHFTPDFIMQMNGKIVTNDYESLYTHFDKFRKSGKLLTAHLPPEEIVVSDDHKKCVVRYRISESGLGNQDNLNVIAIWHISKDGRFERMNEVVHIEPKYTQSQ